jgi:hypothetical protein
MEGSMSDPETVEAQARPYARQILLLALVLSLAILLVYFTDLLVPLRLPLAFLLPVYLAYTIYLAYAIYRLGTGRVPVLPFLAGVAVIVGGVGLDVGATLLKTPTLSREGNLFARLFLDSGFPVSFVYVFGFVAQSLLVLLSCLMWAAFLRHHRTLIELAWKLGPKSFQQFTVAAMRGKEITQRWWGYRLSHYRDVKWYRSSLFVFAGLMALPISRFYLGLEWLGVRWFSRQTLLLLTVLIAILPYYLWLWVEYSRGAAETGRPG